MSETFLEMITAKTHGRVARVKSDHYLAAFRKKAERVRSTAKTHLFRESLAPNDHTNIIAEIKRASPSKGIINAYLDVAAQARRYEAGGAAAISVLTEPDHFMGTLGDLIKVRQTVDVPILRKDFIVDEFQIFEAAASGADAVLLIVAALSPDALTRLRKLTEEELGMDALVEVHDERELSTAVDLGATLIGVNNRDLHSLEVSLDVSREMAKQKPADTIFVAESGISTRQEIDELRSLGFDAFLIGEALMREPDLILSLVGDSR